MRNRSSKQSNRSSSGMEIGGLNNNNNKLIKEEPHLSGAYIRSLVKQLTSSRTKNSTPMNPKTTSSDVIDGSDSLSQNRNKFSDTQQSPQPQQPKKQVRRRLHTSRPYQERLLNMAEARREIVTALKFHRAAMKQANEQQQQQSQSQSQSLSSSPPPPSSSLPSVDHQEDQSMNLGTNPRIYSSNINTNTFSNYLDNLSYSSVSCAPHPPNNTFPWMSTASSIAPLPITENLNLPLPDQPLGLNLNFQDFSNLDSTTLYHSINNNRHQSIYTYPSPSSISSSTLSSIEEALPVTISPEGTSAMADVMDSAGVSTTGGLMLHPVMDDKEMAEIRSIGEQHQMEWNDTLSFVTSAWWFKFMKTMEIDYPLEIKQDDQKGEFDDGFHVFDEIMEFPAWMNNANEGCFLQQHLDDYFSDDYLQEPALPCMDIGEIEGMDGEWLA